MFCGLIKQKDCYFKQLIFNNIFFLKHEINVISASAFSRAASITTSAAYKELQSGRIHIVTEEDDLYDPHIPDIGMDKYRVRVGEAKLGTSGVSACFAICQFGKSAFHISVVGMCHTSHVVPIKDVLKILKTEMVAKGDTGKVAFAQITLDFGQRCHFGERGNF